MKIKRHSVREFADALKKLLPPGEAWEWPEGGFGDQLLMGAAEEFARVEAAVQIVLDNAIERHWPKLVSWHIDEYRRVAQAATGGATESFPRKACAIGSRIGVRLWSHAAPEITAPIPLLQIDHLMGPARIGSRIGAGLWTAGGRYVIRVRYYRSVIDPAPVYAALNEFKQAQAFLFFEDITGFGGVYAPS